MDYSKNKKLLFLVKRALEEDIGKEDITTKLIMPEDKFIKSIFLAKEDCVICGLSFAGFVFKTKDRKIRFKPLVKEGEYVKRGRIVASIQGSAQSILAVERVALNFLCLLCGIATKTKKFTDAVRPYKVMIMDTRKTIPGLRELQKYAVRVGGGYNHRMRLDEMVLIKDNHLKATGDRLWPLGFKKIREKISSKMRIEIEVKTLNEFKKALKIKPDVIMLDNMNIKNIRKAVRIRSRLSPRTYRLKPKLEASGGITLQNVRKFASCGVDMISIGALTHSVNSADISLEIL